MPRGAIPALQNLLEIELEGRYETAITKPVTGSTSIKVVAQNFERLAFSISNYGPYDVVLSPDGESISGSGFVVGAGGGMMSVNWREDILLPGLSWFASSVDGASNLLVVELIRYLGV